MQGTIEGTRDAFKVLGKGVLKSDWTARNAGSGTIGKFGGQA